MEILWYWEIWLVLKMGWSLFSSSSFHIVFSFQNDLQPIAVIFQMWKAWTDFAQRHSYVFVGRLTLLLYNELKPPEGQLVDFCLLGAFRGNFLLLFLFFFFIMLITHENSQKMPYFPCWSLRWQWILSCCSLSISFLLLFLKIYVVGSTGLVIESQCLKKW